MMNTIVRLILVFMLMIVAAPAYSAEATFRSMNCEMLEGDISDDDSKSQLPRSGSRPQRKMKGGERLRGLCASPDCLAMPWVKKIFRLF